MGEVFVALGGADSLQRAAVALDWRVGDVRGIRSILGGKIGKMGLGFMGSFSG